MSVSVSVSECPEPRNRQEQDIGSGSQNTGRRDEVSDTLHVSSYVESLIMFNIFVIISVAYIIFLVSSLSNQVCFV